MKFKIWNTHWNYYEYYIDEYFINVDGVVFFRNEDTGELIRCDHLEAHLISADIP